jgi:hypothetical protein
MPVAVGVAFDFVPFCEPFLDCVFMIFVLVYDVV